MHRASIAIWQMVEKLPKISSHLGRFLGLNRHCRLSIIQNWKNQIALKRFYIIQRDTFYKICIKEFKQMI